LPTTGALVAEPEISDGIVDLLHVQPLLAVEPAKLIACLDFAFAGGNCGEQLAQALGGAPLAPTDWDPDSYAADLFVEDFVQGCMKVEIGGWQAPLNTAYLTRLICHPPADERVVPLRHQILNELTADASLRKGFTDLYLDLCRLRNCFENDGPLERYEAIRRRLETLTVLRDVILRLSGTFGTAHSALSRIHQYGCEITASEGYQRLVELLDYENELAKVDLRLQLGLDGRVRQVQIVHLRENETNRFYQSPLGRLVARVVLWWRGYRFGRDELVDRWLDAVFTGMSRFLPGLFQLLGHMEFYLAALAFRDQCQAQGLAVCFPEFSADGGRHIEGIFNPLLFAQNVVPTPCDLQNQTFNSTTIVTGPNSGGKTRLLQAIGLVQLLGQAGLYVPASRARLRRASGLFVSLVQRTRVDQKEGHLGTELIRIRQLFESSTGGSLVVFDELCSGTNPSEAEQILRMVLALLRQLRPEVFITTHFLQFARRLQPDEVGLGLEFLQVELDEQHQPTFGFVPGVASSSLAAQTAARLGVTQADLMALVRRNRA